MRTRRDERGKQGLVKSFGTKGEESGDTGTEVSVEYSSVRKPEKKLVGKGREEKTRLNEDGGEERQRDS